MTIDVSQADLQRAQLALFEIFATPEGYNDAASRYAVLHEAAPVLQGSDGSAVLSRYEDCQAALRDNRLGKSTDRNGELPIGSPSPEMTALRKRLNEASKDRPNSMLLLNPPDHTRVRGLVSRAFTPRRVAAMRDHIVTLAEECFDAMADQREFDLLEALAFPLPVSVIGELVGVPRQDWAQFRSLVSATAAAIEPAVTVPELQLAAEAMDKLWQYFLDLIEVKRQAPADDLLSALIEVSDGDGDMLSEGELVASAIVMFAAGFETTTNLIGNMVTAFGRNPEQMVDLRANPDLVPSAVEEILRYDSPVQLDGRTVLEPAQVAGLDLEVGARVITMLGAANHDPTRYTEPRRFDIRRDEGPPMSFGSGIHYCLGANLARAEAQVVLEGLLRRFSSVELTEDPKRRQRITLSGFEAVPVRVQPA
ncbi:MAG: cytochrome P450 [Acidimicrobiales bacterium]|nr:cytochrome P450 [Acidimicrobiales bacterium]